MKFELGSQSGFSLSSIAISRSLPAMSEIVIGGRAGPEADVGVTAVCRGSSKGTSSNGSISGAAGGAPDSSGGPDMRSITHQEGPTSNGCPPVKSRCANSPWLVVRTSWTLLIQYSNLDRKSTRLNSSHLG